MSRNKAHHQTGNAANSAWRRAGQAARRQPAADQVMPLAKTAGAAAKRQADKTRAWAAPQVARAGQAVQDSVAPKVSSLLSAAARRLEPEKPGRRRWRKVAGISAAAAAASALAAAVRRRAKASAAGASEEPAEAGDGPAAARTTSEAEIAPAIETQNGQRRSSSDVGEDSAARTS
jgi:hypothetical protein